jgi:hypothetical protein
LAALALAASACIGSIGDPAGGDPNPGVETEGLDPAPAHLRRLLARQYTNAIADLLGAPAAEVVTPPSDVPVNGFESIGAAQLALGDDAVTKYETSARNAARVAIADSARIAQLLGCTPQGASDAQCLEQLITRFGRLAWRRPLSAEEVAAYLPVAQAAAAEYDDFNVGVEYAIAALLQSPNFLYRIELGEPIEGNPNVRRLTAYELATKMSFFLLDTTPDAELLDAAEAGQLATVEGIEAQARALLARPAAQRALSALYGEVLELAKLDSLAKDPALYPQISETLPAAMREETMRVIEDIVWTRNADARELVTADWTYVNAELAALYGMPTPASSDFEKVTWPAEQPRRGLMGQAGFLSAFAHYGSTSPTLRGKFVVTRLLCRSIPAPPPDVATDLPPASGEIRTMKEKLEAHMSVEKCAACHKLMDPIGLALENFDGLGVFRTTENDVTIDTSGEIAGMPFAGPVDLANIIASDPDLASCTTRNLYRHAFGHVETAGEKTSVALLEQRFVGSGFRVQELLAAMAASEAFRLVGVEP